MPVIALDERAESDVEIIATGAFSPLKGFMSSKDYLRVVREMRLENGLPWPMPVTLSVTEEAAPALGKGAEAALQARDGRLVAIIEVDDVFRPDELLRGRGLASPLGHDDPEVLRQTARGPLLVGGEVLVLEPHVTGAGALAEAPARTRARLADKGLWAAAALRTEGLPTRVTEHLARSALELSGGLLLQALEGLAGGAAGLSVRLRCHEALVESYFPRRARRALRRARAAARRRAQGRPRRDRRPEPRRFVRGRAADRPARAASPMQSGPSAFMLRESLGPTTLLRGRLLLHARGLDGEREERACRLAAAEREDGRGAPREPHAGSRAGALRPEVARVLANHASRG